MCQFSAQSFNGRPQAFKNFVEMTRTRLVTASGQWLYVT